MKGNNKVSLYLNTATKTLSVGVKIGEKVLSYDLADPKKALERTHLGIKMLMDTMAFSLSEVDNFYCLLGPGSNTGIRLGLTIPRTIYGINPDIKIFGIPTLTLMTTQGNIAALSDRGGNLFYGIKENEKTTYRRIDKKDISAISDDEIVIEESDKVAFTSLQSHNLNRVNILNLMMSNEDKFIDFSFDEENYLPEYLLKI